MGIPAMDFFFHSASSLQDFGKREYASRRRLAATAGWHRVVFRARQVIIRAPGNLPLLTERPMATATPDSRPTPERIFNALNAFQLTAALKTAIRMDLFSAIAEGHNQTATLAKRIGASERGARILTDYLTVHGFLGKADDVYALTPESAFFLDRKSPAYLGTISEFLVSDHGKKSFDLLPEAVRKGGPATPQGDNTKPQDEFWVSFARCMAPLAAPSAAFMAQVAGMSEQKPAKILDVAASHGMFGITFARQNRQAHIAALDWPAVLEVAKENARAAGVAERFTF